MVNRAYRVVSSADARASIKEHYEHIRDEGAPENAIRVRRRILAKIKSLNTFPHKYSFYTPLNSPGAIFRSVVQWNYIIIYQVYEDAGVVLVHDIIHGSTQKESA